jgi:type II secretory pathway pseudopilin PulG
MSHPCGKRERGATLVVVLVLLIVIGWFAVSTFRLSSQNQQIVANDQARQLAAAAAQRAIEATLSNNMFATDPTAVGATPITTDVDGDGHPDFTAMLTPPPACFRARAVKTSDLDVASVKDRVCLQSSSVGGSVLVDRPGAAVSAGDSMCAGTDWHLTAQVDDPPSGTSVAVHQGVTLRVAQVDAGNYCK